MVSVFEIIFQKESCDWLVFMLFQDDLHIVDSLEIPTDEPQYLEDLISQREWGVSVLFVDV